jgi:CRP-like cAMP-binding protein
MDRANIGNGTATGVALTKPSRVETIIDHSVTVRDYFAQIGGLPTNLLMRRFPEAALRRLLPSMKRVSLPGGEYIYRPDEIIEWVYFPETTAISELHILEDGRTIEVSITGRECAVGVPSIFWPGPAANWIQSCAPGTAFKIRRDALKNECRSFDTVNDLFHEAIQAHIRQISQKVACNAHHSVQERFSTWLLMLHDRCSTHRLKLTQEHIARVLGVYRPSVTCIAQSMRADGLIDYVRGNIIIKDREGLRKQSCDCYSDLSSLGDLKLTNGNVQQVSVL